MGFKTRTITATEQYFELEFDDLHQHRVNFIVKNNRYPEIFLVNPKNYEELRDEMRYKMCSPPDCDGVIRFQGMRVIPSHSIKEDWVEVY